ncbi:DUF1722 domain-containing protein [Kosakonia sacchari]|uniref:DUF1722 domain-containing protein n=1 Tax=Kosakonia sacchari TaxID=1158459 RepID=UPI002ACD4C08|nr:DUF1722 domain-containing protein [Kosakonia sacchari]MDZ7321788.1 DUF1722 domain-containing protein [Kosakonia sacchari]
MPVCPENLSFFYGCYTRLALAAKSLSARQIFAPTRLALATRRNHTRALMSGFYQTHYARQQSALSTLIECYRQRPQPRLAPKTLLKHYMVEFPDASLAGLRHVNSRPTARCLH